MSRKANTPSCGSHQPGLESKTPLALNRRGFLKASAAMAGGLLLGIGPDGAIAQFGPQPIAPASFIHIATDGTITLTIHKPENGQGAETAIAMLLAEELECDWERIRTVFAPIDPRVYGGPLQGTFGSMAVRTSWEPMRRTGAAARQMLMQAAAEQWGISPERCRADNGAVINLDSNARLEYGQLATAAARQPVPEGLALKDPSSFRLLGKPIKRRDTAIKINGRAVYGIDMQLPGMLHAVVARCPVIGGKARSFDASAAMQVAGVRQVLEIPHGIAVVADNTWAAIEGRKQLKVDWDEGANSGRDSAGIREHMWSLLQEPGPVATHQGDGEEALSRADKVVRATYEAPYLAHAPMEPFSALAVVGADSCEVWTGTQIPGLAHSSAVQASGLQADQVKIHTLYMGGGFGSRGGGQWVAETVEIAKRLDVPVKLSWTREDDIQHDRYRPASLAVLAAGLDQDGWPLAWTGRVTCSTFTGLNAEGIDREGVAGLADLHYDIPHQHFEYREPGIPIPTNYWRSVGHSQNTFYAESFLDELAVAAGRDPVEYRRHLLASDPRLLGVLNLAAEKAGWGQPLPEGRYRGVAVANCFGSYNAQVAEISLTGDRLRVYRVVCAIDCGQVVNPHGVEQQMQGGIVYGLSAALRGRITLAGGRVEQSNFHDYEPLRMDEMPHVETWIVPSNSPPGGVGEVATPAIAPAVANAVFAATGKRLRSLPLIL